MKAISSVYALVIGIGMKPIARWRSTRCHCMLIFYRASCVSFDVSSTLRRQHRDAADGVSIITRHQWYLLGDGVVGGELSKNIYYQHTVQ